MKNFEMIVKDIFYLSDGRMIFSGQFINNCTVNLPVNVSIYVNKHFIGKIQLTTLPFSSGKNVVNNIDIIEALTQIDLKFVDWEKDEVRLKEHNLV